MTKETQEETQRDGAHIADIAPTEDAKADSDKPKAGSQPEEIGGQKGPEPTRYGDWEKNGLISDF